MGDACFTGNSAANSSFPDFTKPLKGYEGTTAQCHNCGNWSAHPIQSWNWFTFCWVPIIPLGGKNKDVGGLLIYCCRNVDDYSSLHARYADFDKTSGQSPGTLLDDSVVNV